ncbi:MAG: hypothetical protein V5A55_12175 [Halovenus sp.]
MRQIVSLGSINVDKVRNASEAELGEFERRYDWFPDAGQTVEVAAIPDSFSVEVDHVFHGGKGANQAAAAASSGAETAMLGTVAGSLATRERGARNGIPTLEEVQAFRTGDGQER